VVEEGVSLEMAVGGVPASWVITPASKDLAISLPDRKLMDFKEGSVLRNDFREMLYHDVRDEETKVWLYRLKPHSLATFTDMSRSAAWKKIPSSYLVCEDDRGFQ
jgi:hypothetical protein